MNDLVDRSNAGDPLRACGIATFSHWEAVSVGLPRETADCYGWSPRPYTNRILMLDRVGATQGFCTASEYVCTVQQGLACQVSWGPNEAIDHDILLNSCGSEADWW